MCCRAGRAPATRDGSSSAPLGGSEEAADRLAAAGLSVELIDPRTLVPLDIASTRSTRRGPPPR
jgi:pyruvate/2-oxoglutarate/acetoin dehydrogenase E1 component